MRVGGAPGSPLKSPLGAGGSALGQRPPRMAASSTSRTVQTVQDAVVAGTAGTVPLTALAVTAGMAAYAWWDARARSELCRVQLPDAGAEYHQQVLGRVPTLQEPYRATPFLTNGHGACACACLCRSCMPHSCCLELLNATTGGNNS